MPITDFLSCTRVFDEFESLSPAQRHHAKTYVTGLVAASNKTVAGIAREVLPAQSKRALNKFLTEYNWDEQEFNHERLEELQKHGETRWSKNGYIILDDTITEKAGDEVPGVGRFYDHAEGDTVWGQDLIYACSVECRRSLRIISLISEELDAVWRYGASQDPRTDVSRFCHEPRRRTRRTRRAGARAGTPSPRKSHFYSSRRKSTNHSGSSKIT